MKNLREQFLDDDDYCVDAATGLSAMREACAAHLNDLRRAYPDQRLSSLNIPDGYGAGASVRIPPVQPFTIYSSPAQLCAQASVR